MADATRRSGRATKGQHSKASSSPAPQAKSKNKKGSAKPSKKASQSQEPEEAEDYEDDDAPIRCICGNDNANDKRAFIGCEACEAWQHNVCMGEPDDEDEIPEHYFCEQCRPEEHQETLQAIARGERIWEVRNKIWGNERKAGNKRKSVAGRGGWLKKDVPPMELEEGGEGEVQQEEERPAAEVEAAGSKRKRGQEVKEEPEQHQQQDVKEEEKPTRNSRQDKRRKSAMDTTKPSIAAGSEDPETAIIPISKLKGNRKTIADALHKLIADDLSGRASNGEFQFEEGQTSKSLAEHHASRIEYALMMNQGDSTPAYTGQYRTLAYNLKHNKGLIAGLLEGSLTADSLSTMTSQDMASEELQKKNKVMKEALDRQAVAVQEAEGPKYRRTHKGDEIIEDENAANRASAVAAEAKPVRERASVDDADAGGAGSPTTAFAAGAGSPMQTDATQPQAYPGMKVETRQPSMVDRRSSSQQFDMSSIWARTAQSPTTFSAPRPMQVPPRRRSSGPRNTDGTKDDADVDRMLQDDYETYSPPDYGGSDDIVWRGKLVQSGDGVAPTVNAKFVAGRDLQSTVLWRDLLPSALTIDGRLQILTAEEYLSSLQWSQSHDVSVLQLTPYDDAEGFEAVFEYFKTRSRYAVVHKDKPALVRDLYLIPKDKGEDLPTHVAMLEHNVLGERVEGKCLLATFVVGRGVGTPSELGSGGGGGSQQMQQQVAQESTNGGGGYQQSLPQHMRSTAPGPAGSPLNTSSSTFSPSASHHNANDSSTGGIPPNPYGQAAAPAPAHPNPLVTEILGSLQFAPTAQQVIAADPNIAREKLEHLKTIMEEDPGTRTDINKLAERLVAGGQ